MISYAFNRPFGGCLKACIGLFKVVFRRFLKDLFKGKLYFKDAYPFFKACLKVQSLFCMPLFYDYLRV